MSHPILTPIPPTLEAPAPLDDKRRHPRRPLGLRAWIEDGRYTVYLRLYDLSAGGLSVRAPVPFRQHGPVELKLELPAGGAVRAHGQIVWVSGAPTVGRGPRMGARFIEFLAGEAELYALLAGG